MPSSEVPVKPDPYAITEAERDAGLVGEVVVPVATYARYALLDAEGQVIPTGCANPVELDIWRRMLDPVTKEPTGYLKRERMRTLGEVFADLESRLDVVVCAKCGFETPRKPDKAGTSGHFCRTHKKCGGEFAWFIDEYFNGPDAPGLPVPHSFRWVAAYPVTGGSEGHYVHVEFLSFTETVLVPDPSGISLSRRIRVQELPLARNQAEVLMTHTRLALGKTFQGWEHACNMANRCARLLGA